MSKILQFPTAAERHLKDIEQWQKDLKERYRAEFPGSWSAGMDGMEDMLTQSGWTVDLHDHALPEQTAYVDFDKQTIQSRNWKAYMAHMVLNFVLSNVSRYNGLWAIWFIDDVTDPQTDLDSNGEEYTWFPQMLQSRVMQQGEEIPKGPPRTTQVIDE